MDSDEPISPPSRRHRPSRRKKESKEVLPPPLEETDKEANLDTPERDIDSEKGKGKVREDPKEVGLREREEERVEHSRGTLDEDGQRRVASTSKAALSDSSLTPLNRLPSPHDRHQQPFALRPLSQIWSSDPVDGQFPHTLQASSTVRGPSHRKNDSDSATRSSDHPRTLTSSRKRKQVKRVKSTRANKTMWTQVYQGFGLKEVEHERSDEEEDEEDLPSGSVDRFKHEILPLSTAREKRLRDQKERMDDDPASQYDSVQPDPRKPLKRFSTFMGGDDLETMTKENKRRLLRRPPYRTISTDAQQLDFVSPSDALFDDHTSPRRDRRQKSGGEEKVKRLPPGKTPRTPYLHDLDQTGFAIQVNQTEGPNLYKVTDLRVSDHEAARLAKQGNGWVSTKRKKRNKSSSKKARLQMVTEEEAIDTAKIDPPFLVEPIKAKKKSRKSLLKKPPAKVELRYIPRRLPPPTRNFARRPPPVLVPEPRLTESIQTASVAKSAPLVPVQPSPSIPRPPPAPKAIKPAFRFIVGPKAKRAPTVLVADTPSIAEPVTRPKRHLTFSSPLPEQPQLDNAHLSSQAPVSQPKKKQKLMRRLSTLPDFNVNHERKRDEIEVIVEPEPTFNQYAKSSHSNSQHSSRHPNPKPKPIPSNRLASSYASLPPPPHQAEPIASFRPSQQLEQFNDSNDYFPSSSFERDVLAVLDSNEQTRSSTRNYIAQLQNQQPFERAEPEDGGVQGDPVSSTRWWIGGPTVSAARGTAESEILPFPYRGGVHSEGSCAGVYDDGEDTEVVDSSMIATLGASVREREEEEEPPGSILQGLED